ncbi:amidase [Pseudodonghicola flavimaris]|uniref:Amidase n=1 Tax=Pseudodonghicola flavimaris TaxID=3050036 RepID=A0ABT7F2X0_9RHOB|nr:amidase [Pseudodonghicola flavimaris]MDK3018860.1 amidase [Pseudodonghicola flavimaris]
MSAQAASEMKAAMAAGETTSRALVSAALDRILDPAGEGARAFTAIDPDLAIQVAERADAARAAGTVGPLTGVPVSVKCLFDVAGLVTTAGSTLFAGNPPAQADAAIVTRLRAAGAVIMGHTNMTEFAYSGLGMNPHYGTPGNPADRSRIPGGSSSGAAVSVADGMAAIGIGTDTGGSCRIPAAFCGLVGWKPTARRVPAEGCFPLSQTLDSIGAIAHSVADCELADAVMAGEAYDPAPAPALSGLRFAVLENYVLDGLTPHVAAAFDRALSALAAAGVRIDRITIPDLDRLPELNAHGGLIAAEALALHRDDLATREAEYDPRVSVRIRKGETMEPGEYEALLQTRDEIIAEAARITAPYDAVLMPTVAMEAPVIAELDADEALYGSQNILALRNTTVGNFLDRCAISLPIAGDGLPVGLMLMGDTLGDRKLFAVARAVEPVLSR